NVEVLFVVPRLFGEEDKQTFHLINASEVEVDIDEPSVARQLEKLRYIRVNSPILPYLSPIEFKTRPVSATSAQQHSGHIHAGTAPLIHFEFTGQYGTDLMKEVSRYALVAAEIAGQNQFDVIHAHDWLTYPAGIVAKETSGKPLIVHVHATEFDRSGDNINRDVYEVEKKGFDAADAIIAVSGYTKQILIDKYGIRPEKITVVHNGLFTNGKGSSVHHSEYHNDRIITYLGRITFQKGPDYFVEAARKVLDRFPDVHFVMAGSGDMMTRMIKRVAQLRMSSRFHFTGFLKGKEIERLFAMTDVYVMPSVSEPFGISALEAIHSGVPVIISKQAGISEVLKNVLKVDFWDIDALASAICELLQYRSLSRTVARESGKEIGSLTWDNAAIKIKQVYESLLGA
ncbi:MAG TPA: glycosyltransferase family 4 protein, partial [Candidatus Kapabacteria bacterium]|nr:glycosyltransferase family 4 protein [Candidatus Kapabacteria bacterium]